jgi:hypothetical protein
MPTLLLAVFSTDPDTTGDCDFAVVDMSAALAQRCLMRMERIRILSAAEPDLSALQYDDGGARYYPFSDAFEETVARVTGMDLYASLDEYGWLILPEAVVLPVQPVRRTDTNVMVVTNTEIGWAATPVQSRVMVRTAGFSRVQLTVWARLPAMSCDVAGHHHTR